MTIVRVEGVSKKFTSGMQRALYHAAVDIGGELKWWSKPGLTLRSGEFWALRDVSFDLERGKAIGVIGANGAGKSTLLKILAGLLKPDTGRVTIGGRVRAMIELGAAFTPALSGRENVFTQAALYGYHRRELAVRLDAIVDFAGIGSFIDAPVQQYSDGMRARLGFAVAVHLDPEVLLVDEVLAVGDIAFQNKCIAYVRDYLSRGGSLVFVGHGSNQIQSVCDRGIVLAKGEAKFVGGVVDALDFYLRTAPPMPRYDTERPALSGDATPRVTIDRVEIEPVGATSMRMGGTLRVAIRYTADESIQNVSLGFGVYSVDTGGGVGGGMPYSTITLQSGTHRLSCLLPDLPILPGDYLVRVHLFDRGVNYTLATSGWGDAAHRLVVEADPNPIMNLSRISGVYVGLKSVWEESPVEH